MMPRLADLFRESLIAAATAVLLISNAVVVAQNTVAPPAEGALREARRLLSQHQAKRAEATLRPLIEREPENVDALTLLAEVRRDEGDRNEATTLLLRALAASPNAVAPNLAMGDLLLGDHHDPEAMDRFETVLGVAPANPAARRGELAAATELALSARDAGHPDAALLALQHARTKLPDDPKLLLNLGLQAFDLQLYPDAADALNIARKLNPNDPDILYALARLETERQHLPAAEVDFRAYLEARPRDASAHFGLGHILAMQQRREDARAEFERSIHLQPVQTESYYQIGQLELDAQHDSLAEPLFRKTLQRDPHHGGALTGMGVLAFRAKEYANAEQYLAAAEKTAPDYGPAHYYRGLALAKLGRKDESDAELRTATQLGKSTQPAPQPE